MKASTDPTTLDVMADTRAFLQQRATDAQRIVDSIQEALRALGDGNELSSTQSNHAPSRGMSKANREAASRRMKAYWAKKRRAVR